ncbi:hypothetical protein QL285_020574 [Trifolium repens]|nr:hypothetical protein QL285_020574 [Trifolium repens]
MDKDRRVIKSKKSQEKKKKKVKIQQDSESKKKPQKHQLLLLSESIIKQDPRPNNKSPYPSQNLNGILIGRNS